FLTSLIDSGSRYWLGAVQISNDILSFAWTDGSKFNYSKIATSQANYKMMPCVGLTTNRREWFDQPCEWKYFRQMCQRKDEDFGYEDIFLSRSHPHHYVNGLTNNQLLMMKKLKILSRNISETEKNLNLKTSYLQQNLEKLLTEIKNHETQFKKLIENDNRIVNIQSLVNETLENMEKRIKADIDENEEKIDKNVDLIQQKVEQQSNAMKKVEDFANNTR
ncbi:hypothetical protein B4U79_19193, partial [Dinothrombium tinctorium]